MYPRSLNYKEYIITNLIKNSERAGIIIIFFLAAEKCNSFCCVMRPSLENKIIYRTVLVYFVLALCDRALGLLCFCLACQSEALRMMVNHRGK